jgi:hypothetical protein
LLKELEIFEAPQARATMEEILNRSVGPVKHSTNPVDVISKKLTDTSWIVKSDETFQQWQLAVDMTFEAEEIIGIG